MSIQRIGLVCQVSKCIINLDIIDFETRTKTWLKYPYFFLVGGISIRQCLLKVGNTRPYKKYIFYGSFHSGVGVYI